MQTEEIKAQQKAILATHGVESEYVTFKHVCEVFEGRVAWDGYVNVFKVFEHPKAKHCYAWSYSDGGELQTTTVLEIPPVDSPESAVKVAIASKARQ